MPLSPEIREVVRQAAFDAFTRRLTSEEVFDEVVRLCRDASTPEEVEAAGILVGRITALGKMLVEAGKKPEPEGPDPAAPAAAPEPVSAEEDVDVEFSAGVVDLEEAEAS